jgi:hypothetical protein
MDKIQYSLMGEPRSKCKQCGAWHPAQYELCWKCWGSQPRKPKYDSEGNQIDYENKGVPSLLDEL